MKIKMVVNVNDFFFKKIMMDNIKMDNVHKENNCKRNTNFSQNFFYQYIDQIIGLIKC